MTYSYSGSGFTLPAGVSESDLDWIVLSWDLYGLEEPEDEIKRNIQFITTAEVALWRATMQDDLFFADDASSAVAVFDNTRSCRSMMEWAARDTSDYLSSGVELIQEPFVVDLARRSGDNISFMERVRLSDPDHHFSSASAVIKAHDGKVLNDLYREVARTRTQIREGRD